MSDNEFKDYGPNKAVVNATVQWPDMRLSEQIKHLRFFRDKDNNIVVMPVVLMDPTQTGLNVLPMGRVGISDPTTLNSYARVFGLPCCGWPETTLGLVTHSTEMVQKQDNLEATRTPTVFIAGNASGAGDTTIWATAADRRFRILKMVLFMGGQCTLAAPGNFSIYFKDGATSLVAVLGNPGVYLPNAPAAVAPYMNLELPTTKNGYLSVLIGNDLIINLSAALATGNVNWLIAGVLETI